MQPVAVAAAMANWNGGAYLPQCLAALEAQTRPLREIVIVDNGSTDGSDRWFPLGLFFAFGLGHQGVGIWAGLAVGITLTAIALGLRLRKHPEF